VIQGGGGKALGFKAPTLRGFVVMLSHTAGKPCWLAAAGSFSALLGMEWAGAAPPHELTVCLCVYVCVRSDAGADVRRGGGGRADRIQYEQLKALTAKMEAKHNLTKAKLRVQKGT